MMGSMRWLLKSLALLAYLACDAQGIAERVASIGASPSLALFALLFLLLTAALFLTAAIRNTALRLGSALLLGAASALQQGIERVTRGPLTYEAFLNMLAARTHAGAALDQHGPVLALVFGITLLLVIGIVLPPGPASNRIRWWIPPSAAPLGVLLLSAMLYNRGGEGSRALPASFAPISYAALMGVEALAHPTKPRGPVTLPRTHSAAPSPAATGRDIILIVDESIAPNYLDINNRAGVPTGLERHRPGVALHNYGYAAAVHNCSATSNLVLRFGGTRRTYQQAILSGPSIWAYARKAGLRTVFIDAQTERGALQNLMTPAERAEIDDHVQFDGTAPLMRDMAIADELALRLDNGVAEFIYVNKVGAHFPIQDKYPDSFMRYRPVLPRGDNMAVIWSSDRTGFDGSPEAWARYRNSYRNTLLWMVGAFFDRLLDQARLERATILYTSDHGQDLHEQGNPGRNTHCGTARARAAEGLVPLLVIEGDAAPTLDWQGSLRRNRNGMSHFRIFPTLLALMGYDETAMRDFYGPTLADPTPDPFTFNTRFRTRLGREPEWQHIDLAQVPAPPLSDYRP